MPVNDIISQADYNNIRNKVVGVLGVGSGNSGYGQPLNSTAVAEGSRVTINEYANLRFDIINAWVHQVGSAPSTVAVSVGNTVRFSAVDAPVTTYDALANTLVTNRFNVGTGQSAVSIPANSTSSRTWTGAGSTVGVDFWRNQIAVYFFVTWPTAEEARFFFNSGGQVRITSSRTPQTLTTQQANSWTTLLNNAGTRSFGGNSPAVNWYGMTDNYQEYHRTTGSTPYGSNLYILYAKTSTTGVTPTGLDNTLPVITNNSSGTARSAAFLVQFVDQYTDPGPPDPGDAVDGTFTSSLSLVYPTGVLVPSGFGNFTVTQPLVFAGPFYNLAI
jgi:hypothetical protein